MHDIVIRGGRVFDGTGAGEFVEAAGDAGVDRYPHAHGCAGFPGIRTGRLDSPAPKMAYDLPEGAKRLLQRTTGYKATIIRGEIVLEDDELTGALPGQLVRGPQPS